MGRRLALIIGNSVYRDSTLARLLTPDADVGTLADILLDAEVGGFDDVNVLINMSFATVRKEISGFFSRKKKDDLLLLYFSGHGVRDDLGRLYLAVKDTEREVLRASAIPATFITDEMDNSHSRRQLLILDCCHSGAFARGMKGAPGGSVDTAAAFEGTGFGRVVLTATDATQYAWEGDEVIGEAENSVFTHYLTRGLQTGDADADGDGRITVDELYDYVYAQVVKHTPKQTPGKWSYREQGEIVIALNPHQAEQPKVIAPLPDVDEELERRLEQLYTRGLSAFWLEEWEKAVQSFSAVVDVRPDYEDAADKLAEAKRQQRLNRLYERALAAMETGDWVGSISAFEILVAESPDFEDAKSRFQEVKRQKELADLYSQAQQLFRAKQWQAVIRVFANIVAIEPDYEDPEDLLAKAKGEAAAVARLEELENLYSRALREMNAGQWQDARELLVQIEKKEPGFRGAGQLLTKVKTEIERQEQERQRQTQIARFYEQAKSLAHAGQWRQALERMEEIKRLDPEFADQEGISALAHGELTKEESASAAADRALRIPTQKAAESPAPTPSPPAAVQQAEPKLVSQPRRRPVLPLDRPTPWYWIAGGGLLGVVLTVFAFVLFGGRGKQSEPTDTPATAVVAIPVPTDTLTPTATPEPPDTIVPQPTSPPELTVTATSQPKETPTATVTEEITPTYTDTPTPSATPVLGVGSTTTRERDGAIMVYVPGGTFEMGSMEGDSDEQPVHIVTLDSFWIDKHEVTNAQYRQCVEAGSCDAPTTCDWGEPTYDDASKADHPAVCVDWYGARDYCEWAGARLPTEAEWEYAARGPQGNIYPWGSGFECSHGNFDDETQVDEYVVPGGEGCDGYDKTAPVGSFPDGASWCGALDMAGNVWEWVNDWYGGGYYDVSPASDPPGPESGTHRVLRGGSWLSLDSFVRSASRGRDLPGNSNRSDGFRCVGGSTSSP